MVHRFATFIACLIIASVSSVSAQPLGTFRWQMQPYCNVLTLNVSQQSGVYALDGTDDRCGAAQAASARGMAFLNPNGTIGFGVTMVQPGGVPVHLEATLNAASLAGTWRDSSGASGNLVLTPGAGTAGPPRQVSTSGVPPAAITSIHLANGAVGAAALAANAVSGGNVADGSLTIADLLDEPKAAFAEGIDTVDLNAVFVTTVRQVTLTAPAPGRVIVSASGWIAMNSAASIDNAFCAITTGTTVPVPYTFYAQEKAAADYLTLPVGGTRGFNVLAGAFTVRLNCHGSNASIVDASLTAVFVAGS